MSSVPHRLHDWLFPFEPPSCGTETEPMKETQERELRRIPGLYRRWELAEVLEPGVEYRLEDAGETDCGTKLIALYRSVPCRGGEQ